SLTLRIIPPIGDVVKPGFTTSPIKHQSVPKRISINQFHLKNPQFKRNKSSNYKYNNKIDQGQNISDPVPALISERFHLCPPFSAVVTAALHRHRQIIRPAERGHKQRHKDRHHRLCPLDNVSALKICSSRLLCFHNFISLLQQDRNKAKRD